MCHWAHLICDCPSKWEMTADPVRKQCVLLWNRSGIQTSGKGNTTRRVQEHSPGPVAKMSHSHTEGPDSIPGQGTRSQRPPLKILYVATKTPAQPKEISKNKSMLKDKESRFPLTSRCDSERRTSFPTYRQQILGMESALLCLGILSQHRLPRFIRS